MGDTTVDLALQVQQLNGRLARIEETLRRLEQILVSLSAEPTPGESHVLHDLASTVRVASPRLRHPYQAADFVMTVTRDA